MTLFEIGPVVITMPPNACSSTPADQTGEFNEEFKLAPKELLNLLLQSLSDGDEGDDEVGGIGGDEVRESGRENIGSVANRAVAPVDELQLLAFLEGKEVVEDEAAAIAFFCLSHLSSPLLGVNRRRNKLTGMNKSF